MGLRRRGARPSLEWLLRVSRVSARLASAGLGPSLHGVRHAGPHRATPPRVTRTNGRLVERGPERREGAGRGGKGVAHLPTPSHAFASHFSSPSLRLGSHHLLHLFLPFTPTLTSLPVPSVL